ncbi:hypothetical protein D3C72_1512230 [compost metagenome]
MIDHRVFDPSVVLAAFGRGLAGVKVQPLFKAGAEGLVQGHQNHVEVELVQTLFVLGPVHGAQARIDADAGKIFDIRLQDPLQVRIDQQQLELQRVAFVVEQALTIEFPASLAEQVEGLAQGLAVDAAPVGMADFVGLGEQGGGQLLAIGRK